MKPIILFRSDERNKEEYKVASQYFEVITQRALINKRDKILCRYSALPYMKELENDVTLLGGSLINSYKQHLYCADIQNWYEDLKEYTFPTWFSVEEIPLNEEGPFVIKGRTNSRKFQWNSKMFAKDRSDIGRVVNNLLDDPFIAEQGLVFRKYIQLETLLEAPQGMKVNREYRFFYIKEEGYAFPIKIGEGFYWSSHIEDVKDMWKTYTIDPCRQLADKVARIVCDKIPFVCIDVGLKHSENSYEPILIEVNDGCMSGLSCIDPKDFYRKLSEIF